MGKRKVMINLKDEKGSGLILALMVLLVLSVLGASLGVVTIGSLQLSTVNRDSNSAYYIAEAGANMAYEEFEGIVKEAYKVAYKDTGEGISEQDRKDLFFQKIQDNRNTINDGKPYKGFDQQMGEDPIATVSIGSPEKSGDKEEYTIQSVGKIARKERTVEMIVSITWKPKVVAGGSLNIPGKAAVIVVASEKGGKLNEHAIKLAGESEPMICGDIYIANNENIDSKTMMNFIDDIKDENKGKINFEGYKVLDYEGMGDFSQFTEYVKGLTTQVPEVRVLPVNGEVLEGTYNETELKLGGLNLDVGSNDVVIFTDKLNLGKNTTVEGTGTLTIVVSDTSNKVEIGANADFNSPDLNGKDSANVRIIYTAKSAKGIDIDGSGKIYAQIIAPFHEVVIKNEGTVYGSIVSKTLEVKNKSHLYYHPFKFNNSGTGESEDDGGGLITPEPAIEVD